jgi:hypothetical protein
MKWYKFVLVKKKRSYSPVVIYAGFDRKDHDSIPRNCDWEGVEQLDTKTDSFTRLGSPVNLILVIKKSYILRRT